MKNTKTCPKCNSTEVYTNKDMSKRGERSLIHISTWKSMYVDVYLCISCGYFEEYIDAKELKSEKNLEKFKENFKKV